MWLAAPLLYRARISNGMGRAPDEKRRLRDAVLRAADHGLDPGLFHATALATTAALSPVERDLLLSDAFLSYADALARGAMPIEERPDDEDLTPEPVDIVAVIDAAIAAPDPAKVIEALPLSAEYKAMRRAYAEYRAIARSAPGRTDQDRARIFGTGSDAAEQADTAAGGQPRTAALAAASNACETGSSSMPPSPVFSCSVTTARYSPPGSSSARPTSRRPSFDRRSMTSCSTRPGIFRGRSPKKKSYRNWLPIPVIWPATT